MEIKEIKELMKAFDSSGITSLSFKDKLGSIELKKEGVVVQDVSISRPAAPSKEPDPEGDFVKSPIVGVAYKSPKPGAEPFVDIGQEVTAGQVLCIIEAMKMFNEIRAEKGGIISEILFEDGKLVEFGMPLFKIEVKE